MIIRKLGIVNLEIIKYRFLKTVKHVLGKKNKDDFNWKLYNIHYRGELKEISKTHTQVLQQNDYIFENGYIRKNKDILPLHPNHSLLYETILQLKPESVLEVGCGGGDHLQNIGILSSNIALYGLELSKEQIDLLNSRHTNLHATIMQWDATLPLPQETNRVDIAFTQAVIMHIQTEDNHLVALSNLFRTATKQVILMENWTRHDFMADINKLFFLKRIPWSEIFFYYRDSEELKKPHIMIISSVPLTQYPVLSDYSILSDNV